MARGWFDKDQKAAGGSLEASKDSSISSVQLKEFWTLKLDKVPTTNYGYSLPLP